MPTTGFHAEWMTIRCHRVLLEYRASFPDAQMRFAARLAGEIVGHSPHGARVVSLFYNDKASATMIRIASDDPRDKSLGRAVEEVFRSIYPGQVSDCEVVIVAPGNRTSDHYDHAEHLSVGADVAVDRFRHADQVYMSKVQHPRSRDVMTIPASTSEALLAKVISVLIRNAQNTGHMPEHAVYQAMVTVRSAAQQACNMTEIDETSSYPARFEIPTPHWFSSLVSSP